MPGNIELVTIGSLTSANRAAECVPAKHTNMSTANEFHGYFRNISESVFVVLLFFDPNDTVLDSILAEAGTKRNQLIGVFICSNSSDTRTGDSTDICYVSEQLVSYKIVSTMARFLESESIRQLELGHTEFYNALEQQRKEIVKRFSVNEQLKACHILLIPLNTTRKNVHIAQQRLRNACNHFHGGKYRFIIHTLFDYIPEDNSNPDDESYAAYLEKRYKGDICQSIMDLALIRMYVLGNEMYISNEWVQKLVAAELNINQSHAMKYVDRCTFVIDQPVRDEISQNLVQRFGGAWQSQTVIPKTLVDICNDPDFPRILESIHGRLPNQEIIANANLCQRSLANSEDMTIFSNEGRKLHPAQNCPEEKQQIGHISSQILSNE